MQGAALHPLKELFEKSSLRIFKNLKEDYGQGLPLSLSVVRSANPLWGPYPTGLQNRDNA